MPFDGPKHIIPLDDAVISGTYRKDGNNAIGVQIPCEGYKNFSIFFVRNYNLTTNTNVMWEYNVSHEMMLNQPRPWAGQLQKTNVSFLLMNRGAHFQPDDDVIRDLDNAFMYVKKNHPNIKVFYRSTPHGHDNCDHYKAMAPGTWHKKSDTAKLAKMPFHWSDFERQNEMAFDLIRTKHPHVGFLDFANATNLRSDSHIGNGDCLHYCLPGPIDNWTKMLIASIKVADYMNCSATQGSSSKSVGMTKSSSSFVAGTPIKNTLATKSALSIKSNSKSTTMNEVAVKSPSAKSK
jgi:hypothetical protein